MIVYVNGDSHSAGAEAVNSYCFAEDDPRYHNLGRVPHPDNLQVSYGRRIADYLDASLVCDAESASSNHRIIRTTWQHLQGVQGWPVVKPDLIIIGWSTWERKEFQDPDTNQYWQVNAGGVGHDWPKWLQDQYPKWLSEVNWSQETRSAHTKIYQFHMDLNRLGFRHLFFNTYNHFNQEFTNSQDWHNCYVDPYDPEMTFYRWCINNGFKTVNPGSYHFGADAHLAWAEFLIKYYSYKLLTS